MPELCQDTEIMSSTKYVINDIVCLLLSVHIVDIKQHCCDTLAMST